MYAIYTSSCPFPFKFKLKLNLPKHSDSIPTVSLYTGDNSVQLRTDAATAVVVGGGCKAVTSLTEEPCVSG